MLTRSLPQFLLLCVSLTLVDSIAARELLNLSLAKEAVLNYVDTGCYEDDLSAVAKEVSTWLAERVQEKKPTEKLMLVLDIDETVLSNLDHMRQMDFGYLPVQWDQWVAEGTAEAIKPMLSVFQAARRLGISVVFITGRKETDRPGTEKNLSATGLGDYQELFCKPSLFLGPSEQYKMEVRQRLAAEGWTIIANVGDQNSDLEGGGSERVFKLPNPFYLIKWRGKWDDQLGAPAVTAGSFSLRENLPNGE